MIRRPLRNPTFIIMTFAAVPVDESEVIGSNLRRPKVSTLKMAFCGSIKGAIDNRVGAILPDGPREKKNSRALD